MHIGGGHHHEDASCQNCLSLIGLPSPTLGKVPFFFERQTELTSFGQQSAFQCCLFCLLFFYSFPRYGTCHCKVHKASRSVNCLLLQSSQRTWIRFSMPIGRMNITHFQWCCNSHYFTVSMRDYVFGL